MSRESSPDLSLIEDPFNASSKHLIQLVSAHPMLWDKSCSEYREKVLRERVWTEIAREMSDSFDSRPKSERGSIKRTLRNRWYNIRDSYVKSKKLGIRCTLNSSKPVRNYKYSGLMKFLDSVYDYNDMIKAEERLSDNDDDDIIIGTTSDVQETGDPTRKLINLIKDHPVIWSKDQLGYTSRVTRVQTWAKIYKAMGMTSADNSVLQKKWCDIRDRYVKIIRKVQNGEKPRPYIYSEDMSFLNVLYDFDPTNITKSNKRRRTQDEEDDHDGSIIFDEDALQDSDNWITQNFVDVDELGAKKADDNNIVMNEHVATKLVSMIEKENDEDRAFFTSLLPSVKKLSDESKLEFRMEVMGILKGYVKKEKKHDTVKVERLEEDWLDESFS